MSGLLALHLMQQHKPKVESLVLVTSTPRFVEAGDWAHGVAREVFDQFAEMLHQDHAATLKRFLNLQTQGSANVADSLRQLRRIGLSDPVPDARGLALGLDLLKLSDERKLLSDIEVPCLAFYGEKDRIVHPSTAEGVFDLNNRINTRVIKSAGHIPFYSHADEFLQQLRSFHFQSGVDRNEAGY
jgi:pimeloyl-[acyl-carrier protein] methyl ester esterase